MRKHTTRGRSALESGGRALARIVDLQPSCVHTQTLTQRLSPVCTRIQGGLGTSRGSGFLGESNRKPNAHPPPPGAFQTSHHGRAERGPKWPFYTRD